MYDQIGQSIFFLLFSDFQSDRWDESGRENFAENDLRFESRIDANLDDGRICQVRKN